MPVVEVFGQSARDDGNRAANASRLLNCYREPVMAGGRTRNIIRAVPGETGLGDVSSNVAAMEAADGFLYIVANGDLVRLDVGGGSETKLGVVSVGNASISTNNGRITIVSGGNYYTYSPATSTFSGPLTGAFTAMGSVDYLAGYTLISESGGRRVQWSALVTPSSLPALNFASAEQTDQSITRLMVAGDLCWIFKQDGAEIWGNTGQADDLAFGYIAGSKKQVGLKSYYLAARMLDSIGFVGSDNVVYVTVGADLRPISIPPVMVAIESGQAQRCVYYESLGHKFLAIIFGDRPAWVYDVATGEWHERASGPDYDAWNMRATALYNGTWYGADITGRVSYFGAATSPGAQEMVSATLQLEQPRRVARLEMLAEMGNTLPIFTGIFPPVITGQRELFASVWLSGDGGRTWGKERHVSMGKQGEYAKRIVLRALGRYRQLTVKVRFAEAVDTQFYADGILELA